MTNVLLLWTDQQRYDTLRYNGCPIDLMPQLDALMQDCTVFERAYCASPVCTPSRGSLMTGLMPHKHGAICNNRHLKAEARCLPEYLNSEGTIATGYIGKWHLGDELYAQHGFKFWVGSEDGYQAYFSAGRDKSIISPFQQHLIKKGYRPNPKDPWIRDWSMLLPERDSKPAYIVDRALDFIRQYKKPWVLSVNTLEPHHPLMGPLADLYHPEDLPAWPNRCFNSPRDPLFVKYRQREHLVKGFEDFHCQDELSWRLLGAHYWGQCRQVDNQYGRLLQALKDDGLYDDTLIIFTSDHGEMLGCHGLFGKGVPFEEAARVPLAVKLPGQRKQQRVGSPVSLVDILPTICDALDQKIPEGLDGRSLLPWCRGERQPERDVLFVWNQESEKTRDLPDYAKDLGSAEALNASLQSRWRTLVTPDGYKYTLIDTGEQMLHQVYEDPYEMNDLMQTASPTLLESLRTRLRSALMRTHDDYFIWPKQYC